MKITEIYICRTSSENGLKAIGNITIDNAFVVHDIKIICKNNTYFLAMPSKKVKDSFMDIAHPINSNSRELLEKLLIVGTEILLELDEKNIRFQLKKTCTKTNFLDLNLRDYEMEV